MDVRAAWGGRERFEWRNRLLVLIPIGLIVLISVVDVLSPTDVHLGPLLVIAPALAPSFAGPRTVAAIGALAVVAQVVIAVFHGGLTTSNHLAQIGALIALSALIVVAAGSRDAGSQGPYDETFHAVTEQLKTELGEDREARPSPPPGRSGTAIADSIHMDVGVAAGYAERMGLVESCGDHVRFVHSIIQSYLGVEYLKGLIREAAAPTETGSDGTHGSRHDHANDPLSTALRNDPGRELLTALVLYSRSYDVPPPCPGGRGRGRGSRSQGHQAAPGGGEGHARGEGPRNRRGGRGIARPSRGPEHRQARALDMFGAALDIDRFAANPLVGEVVDPLVGQGWNEDSKPGYWAGFQGSEHQKLERYKKDLVSRLGGTAWFVAHIDGPEPSEERAKASKYLYKSLFGLGCQERSYPVRVATAQEIGCGGGIAFDALREEDLLRDKPIPSGPSDQVAAGGVQTRRSDCVADRQRAPAAFGARYLCHDWQERERQCRQRHRDAGKQERENLERLTRKETLKAWVLPSLVASCLPPKELGGQDIERQKPYGILRGWMDVVSGQDADLRCQVALAQGFKQAANRWTESGGKDAEPGLAREARELMSKCSFWYTKLNLLHALALWEIAKKEKGQGRKTPAPTAEIRRTA